MHAWVAAPLAWTDCCPAAHCWNAHRRMLAAVFGGSGPAPLDEDEIREAVEALLLRRAPAALVRLIGKNAYAR